MSPIWGDDVAGVAGGGSKGAGAGASGKFDGNEDEGAVGGGLTEAAAPAATGAVANWGWFWSIGVAAGVHAGSR